MREMRQGDELKAAALRLADDLRAKIEGPQQGVRTFADHALLGFVGQLEQLQQASAWEDSLAKLSGSIDGLRLALQRIQLLSERRDRGRFLDYAERAAEPTGVHGSSDVSYLDMVMSQGAFDCLQWKGMPLFKTVYDFSLYPMLLWALKPQTIIELGSGTGASAVWLADVMTTFAEPSRVFSVDLKRPAIDDARVTFVEGDCEAIADVFDDAVLRNAPHPWLLIEDAHVNVAGVLRHFHRYIQPGDYVIVEDSDAKRDEIRHFLSRVPGCYKVDTYYTDFFGRNATCAHDSILVRTTT